MASSVLALAATGHTFADWSDKTASKLGEAANYTNTDIKSAAISQIMYREPQTVMFIVQRIVDAQKCPDHMDMVQGRYNAWTEARTTFRVSDQAISGLAMCDPKDPSFTRIISVSKAGDDFVNQQFKKRHSVSVELYGNTYEFDATGFTAAWNSGISKPL